jgi:two-component system, cell cycle response regulator
VIRTWLGSFRVKLVAYFLLLSLVPMAAAFWGFTSVAQRSETRRVDARLQSGLRAARAAYDEELDAVARSASALARSRSFQRALAERDAAEVAAMLRGSATIRVEGARDFRVGRVPALAGERRVIVLGPDGPLGTVIGAVPLDQSLLLRLRARSGLEESDDVVVVRNGRIVAGPGFLSGRVDAPAGRTTTLAIAGDRYRALLGEGLHEEPGTALAVLSPQSVIDAANDRARQRLLLGLLALLLLIGLVAYVEGRNIVRAVGQLVEAANAIARGRLDERVPVRGHDELARLGVAFNAMADQLQARLEDLDDERRRLRDAISRFADALAATHDPDQLLRVIVETAVEATGASGGILVGSSGAIAEVGGRSGRERLELPLTSGNVSFGTLLLFGDQFGEEERLTAASLATHSVVALDNARLHRIVERQAFVDELTGLDNRRRCEEMLAVELSRAARFGDPLTIALADLDDFKRVNDEHGHTVGDTVLREFADVVRAAVRDVDIAGRWGGEEFLLVLPETDPNGGRLLAERIRKLVESRPLVTPEGVPLSVTVSFGIAAYEHDGVTAETLVEAADRALYEAKRTGKNRVATARRTAGPTPSRP